MADLLERVWPVFEAETREQVQALAAGIMELESAPSPGAVVPLRRIAHTLKGTAASLGLHDIEQAAHAVEDVLVLADGGRGLPAGAVEAVLRAARAVEESLTAAAQGRIADRDEVLAGLGAVLPREAGAPDPRGRPSAAGPSADVEVLAAELGAVCTSDGEARSSHVARAREAASRLAAALRGRAAELASRVEATVRELEGGGDDLPRILARAAAEVVELREVAVAAEPRPASPPEGAARSSRDEERSVRVDATRLDTAAADVDQLVVGVSRRERRGRDLERTAQALREALLLVQRGLDEAGIADDARPRALDEGLERIRARGADLGRTARELRREAERERIFAQSLRDTLQGLRMVPAEAALQSLRPAVRELAAQLGKKVSLRLAGGEVRLDRRVLDELKGPLLHLVRNALDHGIEAPGARRAEGKPEEALLSVRVESRGDRVVLTVRDDGAGLSPERLRAAAVQRGIVTAGEAARLGDAEAIRLAFRAGLSTAQEITALSGRGVGLDVVAEAVRRLGGRVDVASDRGRGATFVLDVPLTIAGTTGLLVRAGGGVALLPADAIERVLLVGAGDLGTVAGQVTVSVDGDQVPYAPLARVVGASGPPTTRSETGATVALLVASAGRRVAFAVDEVLGEQAIVVSALGRRMSSAQHVAGAAVLDDGRVVAVLQPSHLVDAARLPADAKAPARHRIVVADDSLGTRSAVKALLEIAGFLVLPAEDGEEALALARESGCDLVVSDVQMPRLDGLGLTRRLKADPKLSHVPVILVTSLDAPEDRAAGLEAGADGYLVKRDVQRGKLLDLVRQLLPA
ncbi:MULTISPECIES: response regulator [unclassified Anaeromyxobacter]|uniref:hybrid sensor histidine kinase/response regulator n=1 Tax=unclassified Anaeromyxobacter TaxID=2620896 RepID=UPI001F5AD53C|nr:MULTISPECIES: response regulator [unclassified Anaeromyxobacter]